eukprot:3009684-Pleurochrysis_carterae.AAC.3
MIHVHAGNANGVQPRRAKFIPIYEYFGCCLMKNDVIVHTGSSSQRGRGHPYGIQQQQITEADRIANARNPGAGREKPEGTNPNQNAQRRTDYGVFGVLEDNSAIPNNFMARLLELATQKRRASVSVLTQCLTHDGKRGPNALHL